MTSAPGSSLPPALHRSACTASREEHRRSSAGACGVGAGESSAVPGLGTVQQRDALARQPGHRRVRFARSPSSGSTTWPAGPAQEHVAQAASNDSRVVWAPGRARRPRTLVRSRDEVRGGRVVPSTARGLPVVPEVIKIASPGLRAATAVAASAARGWIRPLRVPRRRGDSSARCLAQQHRLSLGGSPRIDGHVTRSSQRASMAAIRPSLGAPLPRPRRRAVSIAPGHRRTRPSVPQLGVAPPLWPWTIAVLARRAGSRAGRNARSPSPLVGAARAPPRDSGKHPVGRPRSPARGGERRRWGRRDLRQQVD